jgi:hypothetical protein
MRRKKGWKIKRSKKRRGMRVSKSHRKRLITEKERKKDGL